VKQHNRNDFQITTLYDGWNMVGYPNQGEISKYDITVIHNGTGYTWDDAVEQQIIINFIYGYDAEIDNYEFSDSLKGGEGYWMYVYLDCELWYVE